jgi:spore coat protein U-like protein
MKRLVIATTAIIGIAACQNAWATTATTTIAVTASVDPTCTVSSTTLAFLTVPATGSTVTNANATLSVTCTAGATYDVGLDYGLNAITTQRYLKGVTPANTLAYNLSAASAGGANWGDVVNTDTVQGTGTGSAQTMTVYGQVPGSQTPAQDEYSDTVTVTVTY